MKYLFHLSLLSLVTFNGLYAMAPNEQVVKGVLKIVPGKCRFVGSEVAYFKKALGIDLAFTDFVVPICAQDENPQEPEQHYSQNWNQIVHPAFETYFPHNLPLTILKGKKENDLIKLCVYGKAVELKCVSCVGDPRNRELVAFEQALARVIDRTLQQAPNYLLQDEDELLTQKAIIGIDSTSIWNKPCKVMVSSEKTKQKLLND